MTIKLLNLMLVLHRAFQAALQANLLIRATA